ncbi:unnamed protein product [Rodentolepis nana]|uniref:Uncharacterized protein n=1 Tax=Rodentolepis nana TaxID=102285 RepID=A0A3P7S614_RODNA|nr:unnamed protein product [Rodentolepis nana]
MKKRLLDTELDDMTRSQLSLSPLHRSASSSSTTPSTISQFQSAEVVTLACSNNCRIAIACIADPMSPLLIAIYEYESTGKSARVGWFGMVVGRYHHPFYGSSST